ANHEMRPGPDEAGRAPAERDVHVGGERPANRAGESGDEGDAGDRAARVAPVDAGERGERRLVETRAHAGADEEPAREKGADSARGPEHRQPGCKYQVRAGKHAASAVD